MNEVFSNNLDVVIPYLLSIFSRTMKLNHEEENNSLRKFIPLLILVTFTPESMSDYCKRNFQSEKYIEFRNSLLSNMESIPNNLNDIELLIYYLFSYLIKDDEVREVSYKIIFRSKD